MATKYTLHFADTTKTPFDIQAYTANGPVSPSDPALSVNASGATTTLKLYGRGLKDYGEGVFQDLIYMMEHFANNSIPVNSIEGQIWYNNKYSAGSPPIAPELFIRNANSVGDITDWDAIILATGSSVMTGELTLAGGATDPNHAIPLSFLTTHESDLDIHMTPEQNAFLDGLDVAGSPPALTSSDVNQLIGITGNVQSLLDAKLNLSGGVMLGGSPPANITFLDGGQVLGLPAVPSVDGAAASKKYVDDQLASGIGGDGVLTSTQWLNTGLGSPLPVVTENTLEFTITLPGGSTTTINALGVERTGHLHSADTIAVDNTFDPAYPTDVQAVIEYVDGLKANLLNPIFGSNVQILGALTGNSASFGDTVSASDPVFDTDLATKQYVDLLTTGTVPPVGQVSARLFEILAADLTSPTEYTVQNHVASDNTLSITINGIKQYLSTRGEQQIVYDTNAVSISSAFPTGLDQSIDYEFDISIGGGSPATTITITTGTATTTHAELIAAINAELGGSPAAVDAEFRIVDAGAEAFTTISQGTSSTIVISDPGGLNQYLFEVDASPDTIVDATFYSDPSIPNTGSPPDVAGSPPGSPAVARPDTIEIVGDVTTSFPVGKQFAIRGSDEATYGSYDGIYSVHVQGAVFGGVNTVIPIATFADSTVNAALLPGYVSGIVGSPAPAVPAPSPFGATYITPIIGIDSISTPVDGVEGDYIETDGSGNPAQRNTATSTIAFNYDILSGSKIESLSFV